MSSSKNSSRTASKAGQKRAKEESENNDTENNGSHKKQAAEKVSPIAQHIPQAPTARKGQSYISLTSHAGVQGVKPVPLKWGASTTEERGPIIASTMHAGTRNAVGAHGGSYSIYRSLAVASGALDPNYRPDFSLTTPAAQVGPFPSWYDPEKIVTMDPFGATAVEAFRDYFDKGYDVRPTIAVTKAHCELPEIKHSMSSGRLKPDGHVLLNNGQVHVLKAAVDPVWYLPGVAKRFNCTEDELRKSLFEQTNGMYPELVTRKDLKVFLPPIGGLTIYVYGDPSTVSDPSVPLTVRVHDECNGSDVFGSDICTCRPYLVHGIEECIRSAQQGGNGVIVYFRKEGRALGEVTKYLVYNMRKRQEGGDSAERYFTCTATVAGTEDVRFQALMPDPLHWLGITKIDKLISMSDMKYNAITNSGIEIKERVPIPPEMVPEDAQVEISAKVVAGYDGGSVYNYSKDELKNVKGRQNYGDKAEK